MAVRVTGMTGTGMVCTVGQKFWSIDFFTGYRAYNIKSLVFGHHLCELLKLKKQCCELFLTNFPTANFYIRASQSLSSFDERAGGLKS